MPASCRRSSRPGSSAAAVAARLRRWRPRPAWCDALRAQMRPGQPLYMIFYAVVIVPVRLSSTPRLLLDPDHAAETLKKLWRRGRRGRAGRGDRRYIDRVVSRTTLVGAVYLALVYLIPELLVAIWRLAVLSRRRVAADLVGTVIDIEEQVRGLTRSEKRGANANETDTARTAGGREGDPGARLVAETRHRAALDRRHAARRRRGRDAGRDCKAKDIMDRGDAGARTRSWSRSSPTASSSRTRTTASSSTASRARCRRRRRSTRMLQAEELKLDAVVELRVDEAHPAAAGREPHRAR